METEIEREDLNNDDGKKSRVPENRPNTYEKYNIISIFVAVISVLTILVIAGDECRQCFHTLKSERELPKPPTGIKKFWAYGKNLQNGHLKEVFTVLDRLGYEHHPNSSDWDLLWAHDYPFRALYPELSKLKPHQKVNHFPGCGYITNKVDLSTSQVEYVPRAFKLPEHKEKLLEYASKFPKATFVQKNNDHRNIKIKKVEEVDLDKSGTFVQEYVDKPLLISGHKFDIGIYTVITSVDPLRVYIYNGEALLRFCSEKYYPFDPNNLDKYVVGDDYLPIWELPALDYYYNELGFGMKESLNAHLRSKGKDPSKIWNQIEAAIRAIILAKEPYMADILNKFKSKRNFFEMMRFDFVIDEELNIYLLEANMSPNLSSAHFPPNRLLYQQVLYNVLGLVGVGEMLYRDSLKVRSREEETMIVSDKHLVVFAEKCNSVLCKSSCSPPECQLCRPCLSPETKLDLAQAFREHLHRSDCKRVFPPSMTKEEAQEPIDEKYSAENQLHYRWFQGKCLQEPSWC
ncbi:probable tubulin polyglutamylase ttll-15 [Cylas formicarius]|uniref:probable tubulin polyglutamylase ttll-15 n=1 Tax=Cylas formicarius TaxID=197179 RepID=UPI002958AE0F|nr:probable tubulin polyglutamylase ttll-15 [Cylas formicarius]